MTDQRKPLEQISTIELLTRYRSIQVKRGTEFRSNYLEMNALLDEAKRRDAALAELRQPAAPDADEFAEQMRAIRVLEPESRHEKGDELMCSLLRRLGYEEAINEFESWTKWYA